MTLLEQFKNAREVYISLINEKKDEIISEILKDLSTKFPGLKQGSIVGYTPSFNDGDVCEHWSEVDISDERSIVAETFEDEVEENNLTSSETRAIEMELELIDLILTESEGTNYQFAFVVIDGEIKFETGYYDCGY